MSATRNNRNMWDSVKLCVLYCCLWTTTTTTTDLARKMFWQRCRCGGLIVAIWQGLWTRVVYRVFRKTQSSQWFDFFVQLKFENKFHQLPNPHDCENQIKNQPIFIHHKEYPNEPLTTKYTNFWIGGGNLLFQVVCTFPSMCDLAIVCMNGNMWWSTNKKKTGYCCIARTNTTWFNMFSTQSVRNTQWNDGTSCNEALLVCHSSIFMVDSLILTLWDKTGIRTCFNKLRRTFEIIMIIVS